MKKDAGACIYTRQNAGDKTDDGADCNQHSKETNSGFRSENLERGRALIKRNLAPNKAEDLCIGRNDEEHADE